MKRELALVIVTTLGVGEALIAACGSDGAADDSGQNDASAEGGPVGNPNGGTSGTGSGTSGSGTSGSGTSGGTSSGGTSSGGPRPADDAGVTADGGIDPPDARPGGDQTTISCGATTCPIPAESCCISEVAGPGDRSFACVVTATCPRPTGGGDTVALKCTAQANCAAGTVCCVAGGNNGHSTSACKASCANDEAQLCDSKATDTGCASGLKCSNENIGDWGLPRTFATCGGKGN